MEFGRNWNPPWMDGKGKSFDTPTMAPPPIFYLPQHKQATTTAL
ncbi:hypothetical protein CCACVL1_17722 [Corchorus capsularis]|uniref:Uncharacterized protein n=1 Tax=Corchorus capsularis TaxID=210143 RepID=A0A1R3HQI4_COCAP|nr:hypothetical protein CCACVL1_17722 [Corchorus capsularis]